MEKYFKPLHLACILDEYSPNKALIHVKNGIASATNGAIIVKVNLKETCSPLIQGAVECLDDKYIHMEVWKEIFKCDVLDIDDAGIHCWKNGFKKTFEYSEPNGEFFSFDSIIDSIKRGGEETKRCVSYSPHLIQIISKVFEAHTLHFSFSHGKSGTVVFPAEDSGMYAVLMPQDAVVNRYMFN